MDRPKGSKNKRTIIRETLAKGSLLGEEAMAAVEAMAVVEETMMHFYLRAMQEKSLGAKCNEERKKPVGYMPNFGGHHDCVVVPHNTQELIHSRCTTV